MPDKQLAEAFLEYINEEKLLTRNNKLLVGVSGGIDSVTLCELLHRSNISFAIAHCNFGLRGGESDADDIFVQSLADNYEVPHFRKYFETKKYAEENGVSIQMAARDLRYEWFEEIRSKEQYDFIAVATNLNDDLETMLINFTRGTGIKGLTGIKPKNGKVVRPLLFASRDQIETFARQEEVNWREDSSNQSTKYLRNDIRHNVVPVLKRANPSLENTFRENVIHFKQAEEFIQNRMADIYEQIIEQQKDGVALDKEFIVNDPDGRFILFRILHRYAFHRDQTNQIFELLNQQPGKQFFSSAYVLTIDRGKIFIQPREKEGHVQNHLEPTDMEISRPVPLRTKVLTMDEFTMDKSLDVACLDFDKLNFPLTVRTWQEGDSFVPLGMKGNKKVSDLLVDEKVPLNQKQHVSVVVSGDEIVWVVGIRISDKVKVNEETQKVFLMELII
ncbi:tRNA lysidine(34) synthetase TilS [Salibacter halophilus]|uniref:tRNA(Ile)-lysidine synthase n=1 Tax=Salibacter halophilus TaxID=1803916 RepID=A0A6N6M7I7_9FLAO|nr:tRNA lysidine(34) synthetase TilS [Salibacter halophilus]KAB1063768.1 tRNA lysidine(34) synthetase TilS [Salibacter halophilus]